MSKTLLRHTLTKNIFDIVVDFLIFIHFHSMIINRSPLSLQRQNILYLERMVSNLLLYDPNINIQCWRNDINQIIIQCLYKSKRLNSQAIKNGNFWLQMWLKYMKQFWLFMEQYSSSIPIVKSLECHIIEISVGGMKPW